MNRDRQTTFTSIGDVLARQVMPELHRAARLPLRVTCIGVASYEGCEEADSFDGTAVIGDSPTPEDAIGLASQRVSRGDIRIGSDETLRFQPRFAVILDREHGLVLAGAIRAGIIVWQQPVSSNAEARRVVTDASRLRGRAFAAADRGEHVSAREFRECAALLESRLVDPVWRDTVAHLLRLPQAA
ncbi:MAG: hypothetical protein WA975_00420 [Mesorhizobium sp.]